MTGTKQDVRMSAKRGAEYLGFDSVNAFKMFCRRWAVPYHHVGRSLRYWRSDLDAGTERSQMKEKTHVHQVA